MMIVDETVLFWNTKSLWAQRPLYGTLLTMRSDIIVTQEPDATVPQIGD
jgi:hypothetical protein